MNKPISRDSSVLINFLRINRLDLFEKCSYSFFITDHVQDEISTCFPDQLDCLMRGLNQNTLQKVNVESPKEFSVFADLCQSGQLGAGECAAIAVASCREYCLAIDDTQAIKKTKDLLPPSSLVRTQDLILIMIQEQLLDIEEADKLKETWAMQHRFKLKIKSFSELVHSIKIHT